MYTIIKKVILSILLISVVSIYAEVIEKDGFKLIKETYKGSKIEIVVPDKLSGDVFIYCHGMRAGSTELTVSAYPEGEFTKEFLKKGWIVAATSYRRNGKILKDAVEDVEYLREYIEEKYGKQKSVYLLGSSMGGTIVSLLAEKTDGNYTGIIALGASMTLMEDDKSKNEFTNKPQVPILFLTNQSELKRPQEYIDAYKGEKFEPVLWKVLRDGHCNTNDKEELLAINALKGYVETGKIEKNKEILIELKEKPSTAVFKDGKAYVKVLKISEAYGNMNVDLRKFDLEKLGINHGEYFQVGFKNKNYNIYWGDTYSDVEYGDWVAFFQADSKFKVARNYRNAVKLLQCKEGDLIFVNKIDKPKKEDHYKVSEEVMKFVELYVKSLTSKDFATALKHIEGAKKLSHSPKWLDIAVGNCKLLLGDFEEAEKLYTKHIGHRFEDGSFYYEECVMETLEDLKQFLPDDENIVKMYDLYKEKLK